MEGLSSFIAQLSLMVDSGVSGIKRDEISDNKLNCLYSIEESNGIGLNLTIVVPDTIESTYVPERSIPNVEDMFDTMEYDVIKVIGGGPLLESISNLFNGYITNRIDCTEFDVRNVKNVCGLFAYSRIKNLDLGWLRECKLKTTSSMFERYSGGKIDLSCLNTTGVLNMSYMFKVCDAPIVNWMDTSNVVYANEMFKGYKYGMVRWINSDGSNHWEGKYTLDLSWMDTSKLAETTSMFEECKVKQIILNGWNMENVKKAQRMFSSISSKLIGAEDFNFKSLVTAEEMFSEYKFKGTMKLGWKLECCDITKRIFMNASVKDLDLSSFEIKKTKLNDGYSMFSGYKGYVVRVSEEKEGYTDIGKSIKIETRGCKGAPTIIYTT